MLIGDRTLLGPVSGPDAVRPPSVSGQLVRRAEVFKEGEVGQWYL